MPSLNLFPIWISIEILSSVLVPVSSLTSIKINYITTQRSVHLLVGFEIRSVKVLPKLN